MSKPILLCFFLLLTAASAAAADTFNETFDDGDFEPGTIQTNVPPGYDITIAGGRAVFSKSEGTGNGFVQMSTAFHVKGDFSVTVVANRTNTAGSPAVGLATSHLPSGTGFSDVYFNGANQVVSNIFVDPVHSQMILNDSATPVTFRIRRIGNRLIHECDPGFGYIHVLEANNPVLAGPVAVQLFLGQEIGNTAAHTATFDDWSITGDAFVPPCGNGVLDGGEVCDDDDPSWVQGSYCNAACMPLACGDTDDSGTITATDALFTLRAGVGVAVCDDCVCDVDSSGGGSSVTATDALRILQNGIGLPTPLNCPPCP